MSHLFASRRGVRRATITACLIVLSAAGTASAAPLTVPADPLAVLASDAARPACDDRYAPRVEPWTEEEEGGEFDFATDEAFDLGRPLTAEEQGIQDEFEAAGARAELLPAIVICSPTFPGVPGAPTGSLTSERRLTTRVGPGWRELGQPGMEGAVLRAGDRFELPAVDANTVLRVHVGVEAGGNTTPVTFSDLSQPSTLTISANDGSLLVRLARRGGATTEQLVSPPRTPAPALQIGGTARRWELTSQHLPGTAVVASVFNAEQVAVARASSTGTARFALPVSGRPSRRIQELVLLTSSFDQQSIDIVTCGVSVRRPSKPKLNGCKRYAGYMGIFRLFELALDELEEEGVGVPVAHRSAKTYADTLLARLRRTIAAQPASAAPSAADSQAALRLPPVAPARASATGTRQQAAEQARPRLVAVPRSRAMVQLRAPGIMTLEHDLNGDGKPEFWSDLGGYSRKRADRRKLAGYLYLSSPKGLVPRRVVIPDSMNDALSSSELSSIADVTGDGLGELIVDLGERHAIVPGSHDLAARSSAIVVREGDAGGRFVLTPSLSSPGAPYATVDDVTGDGRSEIVMVDDSSVAMTLASQQVSASGTLGVPAGLGRTRAPDGMRERHRDSLAPKGDPTVRVIGGRIVTTSWKPATALALGQATFSVVDGRGNAVQPPVTLATSGDASLLDYDRASGDLLVWVAPQGCIWDGCRQAVLRVGADGAVKQLLQTDRRELRLIASSARFMPDGPDGDGDVEVVFSWDDTRLGTVASTVRGELTRAQLTRQNVGQLRIGGKRYAPASPLRVMPVVAADGSRTMVIRASRVDRDRYDMWVSRYPDHHNAPLQLAW